MKFDSTQIVVIVKCYEILLCWPIWAWWPPNFTSRCETTYSIRSLI